MRLVVPWDRVAFVLEVGSARKLLDVAKVERAGERRLRLRALV